MIGIYEPLYAPGQKLTESSFLPLEIDNGVRSQWREFKIYVDMYRAGIHRRHGYTGLFSPKFHLKTGIRGDEFVEFVASNSQAQVCFVNAFPQLPYFSYNVWMEAECAHPGIGKRAQALIAKAGINWTLTNVPRHGPDVLCYCNFWVGDESFWERYVGGVLVPIAEFLERNPTCDVAKSVLDDTQHSEPTAFLPFIVERLFSTYLSLQENLVVARFKTDPFEGCLNEFESTLLKYIKVDVDREDERNSISDEMKDKMRLFSKLRLLYILSYYAHNPHPHVGTTIKV
jgi:hypothetical protein